MKIEFGQKVTDVSLVGKRDAVHVPVICAENVEIVRTLRAGDFVIFTDDSYSQVVLADTKANAHGIVDPFLKYAAKQNERVWIILVPNATSNLSHTYDLNFSNVAPAKKAEPESLPIEDYDDGCRGCW
jgi:hypothetical protein